MAAGCVRFSLRRAADSRDAHTVRRAGAVRADTALKAARGTPSALEGFVGRSPQGEAHEATVSTSVTQARQATRLRSRHALGPNGFGTRTLG
jgi:hypothetical protein